MKTPKEGSGKFQWNTGGWFGAQIGSTLWLLLLGMILLNKNVIIGSIILLFFILPNMMGWIIWSERHRIEPYPAIQALLGMIGFSSLFAVIILDLSGYITKLEPGMRDSPKQAYWYLLIFPVLMIAFHFLNSKEKNP
jgi:hypothetical protein